MKVEKEWGRFTLTNLHQLMNFLPDQKLVTCL